MVDTNRLDFVLYWHVHILTYESLLHHPQDVSRKG